MKSTRGIRAKASKRLSRLVNRIYPFELEREVSGFHQLFSGKCDEMESSLEGLLVDGQTDKLMDMFQGLLSFRERALEVRQRVESGRRYTLADSVYGVAERAYWIADRLRIRKALGLHYHARPTRNLAQIASSLVDNVTATYNSFVNDVLGYIGRGIDIAFSLCDDENAISRALARRESACKVLKELVEKGACNPNAALAELSNRTPNPQTTSTTYFVYVIPALDLLYQHADEPARKSFIDKLKGYLERDQIHGRTFEGACMILGALGGQDVVPAMESALRNLDFKKFTSPFVESEAGTTVDPRGPASYGLEHGIRDLFARGVINETTAPVLMEMYVKRYEGHMKR